MKRLLPCMTFGFLLYLIPNTYSQITLPYTQDFETFAQCGGSCTSTCFLQDNWTNGPDANRDFSSDTGGTSSSNTGPEVDHTLGNGIGRYLYAEASSPCYIGSNSWHLISPTIDLNGSNNIQFSFWYHMYGSSMGSAHIDVTEDDGLTWVLDVIPSWSEDISEWQQVQFSLVDFSGQVKVRIRYDNPSGFYGDFAIDDVVIYDLLQNDAGISSFINPTLPTCDFSNDSIKVALNNFGTDTLTSVNINWSFNSNIQTVLPWTGSLGPNDTDTVFLGTTLFTEGDTFASWTDTPNGFTENQNGNINDTTSLSITSGFNGLYTIGATGDFTDLSTAINSLKTFGVCGPTIFDIEDGIYNEQMNIDQAINGIDSINTVTFRSQSADAALVKITYASISQTDNYILNIENSSHFIFKNLTLENTSVSNYTRVINVGASNWITVEGCHLKNPLSSITSSSFITAVVSSDNPSNNCSFINNTIEGGSTGIRWSGISAQAKSSKLIINGNLFVDQFSYASLLEFTEDATVTNNVAINPSGLVNQSSATAFRFEDSDVMTITNNQIYGGTGIWKNGISLMNVSGNHSEKVLIANNMVQVGASGLNTTMYGIYMLWCGHIDLYGNNLLISGGSGYSTGIHSDDGGEISIKNNNCVNYTTGLGIYLNYLFQITDMDYNNIYVPNGNLGGMISNTYIGLSEWQAATTFDANSISTDPLYHSNIDLHVCSSLLSGGGVSNPAVTLDFDGQMRDVTSPDIGADEFTPISGNFLGADASLCLGDSVQLFAGSPSDTITWSTGESTTNIWVSSVGTYDVSVTGYCGTNSDTINIFTSNDVYTDFLSADTVICEGDSVALSSNIMANSYTWTHGPFVNIVDTLNVTTTGTYTLDIIDACGSGTDSVDVLVISAPTASFNYSGSYESAFFTNTSTSINNTYLWDFGDGSTSTEENPHHIFSDAGPHTVTLTVTNNCGSDIQTSIISMVGLEDNSIYQSFKVSPNPNNGEFTISIRSKTEGNFLITVENILGKSIYSSKQLTKENAINHLIDLKDNGAGVYFVKATSNGQSITKKIIIN